MVAKPTSTFEISFLNPKSNADRPFGNLNYFVNCIKCKTIAIFSRPGVKWVVNVFESVEKIIEKVRNR